MRPPRKSRMIKLWGIVSSALPSHWSPCTDKSFFVLGLLDDRVSGSGNVQAITTGHLCLLSLTASVGTAPLGWGSPSGTAVCGSGTRMETVGAGPQILGNSGTPGPGPGQGDSGLFSGETAVGPGRNPTFAGTPCHPLATAVPGRLPGRSTPGIRLFIRQHLDSKNKCMVFIFPQSNMLSDSIKCSF